MGKIELPVCPVINKGPYIVITPVFFFWFFFQLVSVTLMIRVT